MSKVLMTWYGNYADEFDVSGWIVTTKEDSDHIINTLVNHKSKFYWYFGTNEYMEYDSGGELAEEITVTNITEKEYNTLNNLFDGEFGYTRVFELDYLNNTEPY
jgi:hypothetical protein